MKVVIDRFEGFYAVCEIEKGRFANIPIALVPDAKEGDIVSFDSDDMGMLFVNDTHDLENGELVICIDTDDAALTDPQKSYNISLDFYSEDLSEITYTSRIKSVPSSDVAIIPQTGDNAVGFVFIAVTSLILMTFILAPKRSRFFSLSK